jgi:hypothetical protein
MRRKEDDIVGKMLIYHGGYMEIGKVYKRLILMVARKENADIIETLERVYDSFVSGLIEDYNGSFYYENPDTIFQTYLNGGVLMD